MIFSLGETALKSNFSKRLNSFPIFTGEHAPTPPLEWRGAGKDELISPSKGKFL